MKNTSLKAALLLAACFTIIGCSSPQEDPNTFTVTGFVKGLDTEYMSTSYTGIDGQRVSDSVMVENDRFTYTGQIKESTFVVFWPNVERTIKRAGRGYYPVKSSQFAFLASPGDKISFEGEVLDFINAYPSGTPANNELASINSKIFPLMNKSINTQLEINELDAEDPKVESLRASMNQLDEEVNELKKQFIADHPNSQAAAWYLSDMMVRSQVSQEEAIDLFRGMNTALTNYPFYDAVAQRVEGIESTRVGRIMPNFTTNATVNGETFNLESLRGKYVLIDFWGTWCAPCIAEMPEVKEYHEKYSDRLVVVGVNNGDTIEEIKEFTEPKGYHWLQIKDKNGEEDLVLKLNVAGFPTKFILSPEGEILYRFVGNTVEAFDALDELLGE